MMLFLLFHPLPKSQIQCRAFCRTSLYMCYIRYSSLRIVACLSFDYDIVFVCIYLISKLLQIFLCLFYDTFYDTIFLCSQISFVSPTPNAIICFFCDTHEHPFRFKIFVLLLSFFLTNFLSFKHSNDFYYLNG